MTTVELPWNGDGSLPCPGDLIVARRRLRAWASDQERGDGITVEEGALGLVLQRWREGSQLRLRVLINDAIVVFSHHARNVTLNWAWDEPLAT